MRILAIKTNGVAPATFSPADPAQPTILLNGAQRIVIDGVRAAGITVDGGISGVAATRNSTLTLANCAVKGTSRNGVLASFGGAVSIDACQITDNDGNGVAAANTASAVITNSTVSGNAGSGLVATRTSYLRVGQDQDGTLTVKPVTVSGNGTTGISITENSSGNIVGGVVESSGGSNIFVGRASSGQIGVGSNGLTGDIRGRVGAGMRSGAR